MNELKERYQKLDREFTTELATKPSLRVNTLKITPEKLLKRIKIAKLAKIPYLDYGYWYESEKSLGATPEYLQGHYYLQEAASQLPVQIMGPKQGETILDMAASPGSKTTQIAQYMQNKGVIVALDSNNYRLQSLRNNLERLGVINCVLYKKDARFAFDLGKTFDKVLLDAPCSGNFTIEKEFFETKKLTEMQQLARTQKELIRAAMKCLKPNGTLVYSTCSLEPEEDEMNIHWLLEKYPEARLERIDAGIGDPGITNPFGNKLNPELSKTVRLWPHRTGTQGFFIAKINKISD